MIVKDYILGSEGYELKIVDNFTDIDFEILDEIKTLTFTPATSFPEAGYIGTSSEMPKDSKLFKLLYEFTENFELLNDYIIQDAVVNQYNKREVDYFHHDTEDKSYTVLIYLNDDFDFDDGGENKFIVDGELFSVAPKPFRIIYFDGRIAHTATPFNNKERFTAVLKLVKQKNKKTSQTLL